MADLSRQAEDRMHAGAARVMAATVARWEATRLGRAPLQPDEERR